MIVIWIMFPVTYRKAIVRPQKRRKGKKNTLSENTEEKHKSVHQKGGSRGLTNFPSQRE